MKKDNDFANNDEKVIKFPKAQKNKKSKKTGVYFVCLLVLIAVVFLVSKACDSSNFNSTNAVNTEVISLSNANNFDFAGYSDGYVLAKDGKISCHNTNHAVQWEVTASKTAPKVVVNDDYVLTYYNDDKLAVITNGNKTTRIETPGNVQLGYVNTNGFCVLLLDEYGLKNKIVVYNKKGEMLYYRDNPDKFISHVALSDDNKTLLTTELITTESSISSELIATNIKKNESTSLAAFDSVIPGGCILTGKKDVVMVFETKMQCYSLSGRLKWETDFGNKRIFKYSYDDGIFACVFNVDDSANSGSEVVFYNKSGKRVGGFETEEKIQDIDLKSKTALLTMNRQLVLTNQKGKQISAADITYDMKKVIFMGTKKCALIISNSQDARLLPLK